ncbi:MAG: pitrilysin family protein [Acidobacteriota bacterium]
MTIKRSNSMLAVLSMMAMALPSLAWSQVKDWKDLKFPPLHKIDIQEPRRIDLPNGMIILLQEDHELPLISGTAVVRGGSREEPAEKAGLIDVYGDVWRTGGTTSKTGDELDDVLESRAAKVETGGDIDSTTISFDALKGDFDSVFAIFVDLLRNPAFREDKLGLAKDQINTGISRRNDDPAQIAGRESQKLAYGANSPYARTAEYYTVQAITRDDLVAWHKRYVQPNNIILGIAGDFDPAQMEQKLRKQFQSWPKGPAATPPQIAIEKPTPGIYFVPKEDINQSSIRMVAAGTMKNDPDYYTLQVLNEILSGGFSSRLVNNIRSKKGLAYSVGGGVGTSFDHPGIFSLAMGTKSQTTAAAIDALNEELDNLVKSPPTEAELNRAQESILNSFIFSYDSKQKILQEQMSLTFYGYPADFLERFRSGVEKVTTQDLARVAKKFVHRNEFAVLVVGKPADFDRPLSSFGTVKTIDITIPEAAPSAKGSAAAAPSATGNQEGRDAVAKVLASMGGKAKVAGINAVSQKAQVVAKTPQGDMPLTVESMDVFPDRSYQKMITPMGAMTMVVTSASAFMSTPGGSQDMPASQKEEQMRELRRDPIYVLQHADDAGVTFTAAGTEKIGDVTAQIVDVSNGGVDVRWYVDLSNGHIIRTSNKTMTQSGPGTQVVDYSDWRTVSGVSVAFKRVITVNGQPRGSVTVEDFQINPAVDSKLFEKPPA